MHLRELGPGLLLASPGREADIASQMAANQIHREDTPSSVGTILSAATDPRMGVATSRPEYPPVEAPETTIPEQRDSTTTPKREREP